MRSAILLLMVLAFVPIALLRPKWGLLGYISFSLCRPDYLAWAPSNRLSFIIATATLFGSAPVVFRWVTQLRNPFVILLLILLSLCLFSTVLAVNPDAAFPRYWQFVRASLLAIAIPVLLVTVEDLTHGILAIVAGLAVIAAKFGLYGIIHGGTRYSQGYFGMMTDNNTLALGLVMGFPLAFYSLKLVKPSWRPVVVGAMFFFITTIIMTFSRGAALSLAAAVVMIILVSKKKIIGMLLVPVLGIPALLLVGPSYFDRIESTSDYDSDTSIISRLDNARSALVMWRDYPIHGVGFGMLNQQMMFPRYLPATARGGLVVHNTYLQLLTDTGLLGFGSYVILLFGSIWWLGRSAKRVRKLFPELEPYPRALQISLIACAVGTTFLSRADFDLTYMILMACAAWWSILNAKMRSLQEGEIVQAAAPLTNRTSWQVPGRWAPPRPAITANRS
jgi:putative inorganic carbon (hco3(-)) transporter